MNTLYIPADPVCKESLMQIIALFSNLMTFVALHFYFISFFHCEKYKSLFYESFPSLFNRFKALIIIECFDNIFVI